MPEIVEAPPDPTLFAAMRNMGYTPETAIADLVDNSISAESTQIHIEFKWLNENSTITVSDNGKGMDKSTLIEAMKLAAFYFSTTRTDSDLGRFGLGLKTAGTYLGRRLTVITNDGSNITDACWDLDNICSSEGMNWNICVNDESDIIRKYRNELSKLSSGTIILIEKLDSLIDTKNIDKSKQKYYRKISSVQSHLRLVFHRFIEEDELQITINNELVVPWNPFISANRATQELDEEIVYSENGEIIILPYVLPHRSKFTSEDEYNAAGGIHGWIRSQGIYLYRNRRLIKYGTWFDIIKKENTFNLARIQIDILPNHDEEWKITVDKSKATVPVYIQEMLKRIVANCTEKSTQVYNSRGSYAKGPARPSLGAVWEQRKSANGEYSYHLNKKHPLYISLQHSLNSEQKEIFSSYISLIENFSPVLLTGLVHYSQDNEQKKIIDALEKETDLLRVKELIEGFRKGGCDPDEIQQTVLEMPYYAYLKDEILQLFESDIK
ncbi:ATP-binding protein [Methanocorpusculum parvum]|nr:ATP-binding protein [Methanocorpusculum parvum]